jgi:hypothetical protein
MYLYFVADKTVCKVGPYGPNHSTNGTLAYRKSYAKSHVYDIVQTHAEEQSFLENYRNPMIQLDPMKCILCICHSDNTFDKMKIRMKQLIKRKEFKEEEFKIVDIVEGEGNRSGMAGNILVEMSDGKKFGSGIQGDREFYRKLLKEKDSYIGTQVSIKYQNLTPDGIPRFPVAVKFWNSKTREF